MIDHRDVVAHFLREIHKVRRKQDDFALTFLLQDNFLQKVGVDGIHSREGLIQNEEIRDAYELLQESRKKYENLVDSLEEEYIFFSKSGTGTLLSVSPSVNVSVVVDIET